jgi:hypothetical protein
MIGKISIGKSFRGCLSYCLENKDQKLTTTLKKRAEILSYNLCFGNKKELINQFNDVRKINPKLSKPVLHITLSFAPGEKLGNENLQDLIEQCAQKMGFEKNQFVAIEHSDTTHQHIHIVANRVRLDGKTVKDHHNYKRIADYCREMETKYNLEKVLSPKKFLPKEQREIPRIDLRKNRLRIEIGNALSIARNYKEFESLITSKGYVVYKARGIAFVDNEKVRVKGSEVGYSLQRIEQLLSVSTSIRKDIISHKEQKLQAMQNEYLGKLPLSSRKQKDVREMHAVQRKNQVQENQVLQSPTQSLDILLKSEEQDNGGVNKNLIQKKKKKHFCRL